MMVGERKIIISGSGGQGVILAGIVLAEAAAIYDDKNAIHNQSYGPEARGGASKSEVIISDGQIHFPEIETPDILVALTREAVNKFAATVAGDGILIVDARIKNVPEKQPAKIYRVPISDAAVKIAGNEVVTNMVTLGVLAALTNVVTKKALADAIVARVPKGTSGLNIRAMEAGFALAAEVSG